MFKRLTFAFCTLSFISFMGCECTKVDCYPSDYTMVDLRIVSSIDSSDLIFGMNPIYTIDDLSIFGFSPLEERIDYTLNVNELRNTLVLDYQSFDNQRMYIDYGNGDIDTLDFNFFTVDAECCGELTRIRYASQNGNLIHDRFSGGTDIIILEK